MSRLHFNRVMWFIAGMLVMALVFMFSGCATLKTSADSLSVNIQVNPADPNQYTIVVDANNLRVDVTTIGKDVNIGKGFMSTVSPKNQGIIEAVAGFVAGAAAFGL